MTDTEKQIQGRKMEIAEQNAFDKAKAITKIQTKQDKTKQQLVVPMNNLKSKLPAIDKRYTKQQFCETIEATNGIITLACNVLDCTYTQFYNAVKKWRLNDFVNECKKNLVARAEEVIFNAMGSANELVALRAAETTLRSQMAAQFGWGQKPEVQIQQQINISDDEKKQQIQNIFGIK